MVGEGTAVITARTQAGGLEASCTVSSQSPVAQAQLTPDSEDDPSLAGEKDTPHSSREEQEELSPQENTSSGLGEKPPLASSSEPESNSDRYRYLIKRELADPTLAEQDSSYQGADSQAKWNFSRLPASSYGAKALKESYLTHFHNSILERRTKGVLAI